MGLYGPHENETTDLCKKKKKETTPGLHTHKVHTFFRNCKVTEKGKKERKNGGKGGTYAPH